MKIFSAPQIRAIDNYTIKNEPITSIDLMERASKAFVSWFTNRFYNDYPIIVFAGLGNNGGDGLAVSRLLLAKQYHVTCYAVRFSDKTSDDFKINENRLEHLHNILSEDDFPPISTNTIVIDAIFGSGLSRPISGFTAKLINHINQSNATIVSIDIASGLFCDSLNTDKYIIKPDYTVSFQFPKLSFLLPQNDQYVGEFEVVDIGLMPQVIAETSTPYEFVDWELIFRFIKRRPKYGHKGTFGHVLLIGGSYGKIGAAILAGKAALRTGSGLVSVHLPKCGYQIMQTAVPEIMCSIDQHETLISELPNDLLRYQSIGIGPGIGKSEATLNMFAKLIQDTKEALVIDADALNLLAENQHLLSLLPNYSILTPHPKEFERLAGKTTNHYQRLEALQNFSKQFQLVVVLKGAHTAIATPDGKVYFNSTGNSGMGTAGSGDVLTGMITSLLGQGYDPIHAAIFGVFLHGLAGDYAKESVGEASLIASDIIQYIGMAYEAFLE